MGRNPTPKAGDGRLRRLCASKSCWTCLKARFRLCAASRLRVHNASPLILLAKVSRLTLLPKLTEGGISARRTLGVIVAAKVRGLIPAAGLV